MNTSHTGYYDIIGDIHGHADELSSLLSKLGYRIRNGSYSHDSRQAIFLGDFIDRGPKQRETIEIVRPMIENGNALSVMGNHEFNAICFGTLDSNGSPLRKHTEKNISQHQAFLDAFPETLERQEILTWFKQLPVYIDLGHIRIIHACWSENALLGIESCLDDNNCIKDLAYPICSEKGNSAYLAIETLMKGPEVKLPDGVYFKDPDGHVRDQSRIKWWLSDQADIKQRLDLGEQLHGADNLHHTIIDDPLSYDKFLPPVFFGHYWLNHSSPTLLSDNCACLDYSVAKGGKLVAYRWQGEKDLNDKNFVY